MALRDDFTRLERAERIARLMDNAFRVPFTRVRIGADSVVGLIPGIGDTLALLPALYILVAAWRAGASNALVARMGFNVGVDWLVGLVPVLGDLLDIGWKGNLRNVALLRAHVENRANPLPPLFVPAPLATA